MGVTQSGASEFEAYLTKIIAGAEKVAARAMYEYGQLVLRRTLPVTPIEYGPLRASGHVTPPVVVSTGVIEVTVGFGGAAAPYAIYVHENLTALHREPTKAKFLESTVLGMAGDAGKILSERMAVLLK